RVLHGIGHADWSPLRNTEQWKRLTYIRRRNDGLQVFNPPLNGEVTDVRVGHSASTLVVTHEAEVVAEKTYPVPPHWTLPFVLEVSKPVRGLDHYRSLACVGPGELDSIRSSHVSDSLGGLFHIAKIWE